MPDARPPARSPRKARGKGQERREEILAAALSLFGAHGITAVSTRQIAAAVGISQAALFSYFPTRDDLSAELCIRALDDLQSQLAAAAAGADAQEPEGTIARMCAAYIAFALDNPDRYRLAFMFERGVDGAFLQRTGGRPMEAGVRVFRGFAEAVVACRKRNCKSGPTDMAVAMSVWASLHGLASLLIARPEFPWGDRSRLVDAHIRLVTATATA